MKNTIDKIITTTGEKMKIVTEAKQKTINDTKEHINEVRGFFIDFARDIMGRAKQHDSSKLEYPELDGFAKVSRKLKGLTYGSKEYKENLAELKPILDHHYANNRHHPEHFKNGVNDMTLIDVVEMFCDWLAATKRHADGDILKSIAINKERFKIDNQLIDIFVNTANSLNFGELVSLTTETKQQQEK